MIEISVIIVIRNEENYVIDCIKSIEKQFKNNESWELIVIDGVSEDNTKKLAYKYLKNKNYKWKILDNPKKTLPSGWNIGIKNAKGKYVIRPDAHSELLENYIILGIKKLEENLILAGVGGVLITKSDTYIGDMISKILSNPIGVGASLFRVGVKNDTISDTAVYAVYKKTVIEQAGMFDENLIRNQDIDLHKRIQKLGYKLLTSPEMKAIYYSRTNIKKFLKQAFNNGFWITYGDSGHFRHYIPLLFVIIFIFSLFNYKFMLILLFSYTFLVIFSYIIKSKIYNPLKLIILLILTFFLHICYGIGSIIGLLKKINKKFQFIFDYNFNQKFSN